MKLQCLSEPFDGLGMILRRTLRFCQLDKANHDVELHLRVAWIGLGQRATYLRVFLVLRERVVRATLLQEHVPQKAERNGEIALLLRVAGIGLGQHATDFRFFEELNGWLPG